MGHVIIGHKSPRARTNDTVCPEYPRRLGTAIIRIWIILTKCFGPDVREFYSIVYTLILFQALKICIRGDGPISDDSSYPITCFKCPIRLSFVEHLTAITLCV